MHAMLQRLFADPYGTPSLIRRLLREHARPNLKRYLIAFTLMMIGAGATVITTVLFGDIVNQAYLRKNMPALTLVCFGVMAVFIVKGLATYGSQVQMARIGNAIVADNERRMFGKLLSENLQFFADRHSSEFMGRMTTAATATSQTLNLLITAVGRDVLTLVGLILVMAWTDPTLLIASFAIAPPLFVMMRQLVRRARAVILKKYNSGIATLETLQEALQGIRIVKAFTLEDTMRRRAHASIGDVEAAANKMARVSSRSGPLMETLAGVVISLIVLYGGYRVINTGAKPGEFVSFMAAFLLGYEPAKRLARLNFDLANAMLGVRLYYELIDSPATEPDDAHKPALVLSLARVEFREVQFAYRPGEPVLKGMSFVGEPGKVTALVGPSGGGKSTVLNLILRFYDVGGGKILIDGQDIATVTRRSLREQIGYVGQDVFLFRGSIRENIAFGKPGATEEEIVAAAKAAHAHEFITGFPAGYDTSVGEHGLQLSGGQRQRVAIARALVRNAPIILLDEATAALDSESESLVQDAMKHLCEGRTTLVIAHRLNTITHADRILVVENGVVVEQGRHDELLRRSGRYASFFRLQLREQASPEPVAIASSA